MEIILFLLVFFLAVAIIAAISGAALAADDNQPTEQNIRQTGKQTRASIDAVSRSHKAETFNYLYKKHQESVREVLHE